jgi:hypothetical protein
MPLVKISEETLALIGATGVSDFPEKLSAFITKAKTDATFMAESKVTLETLQQSLTALEGKILTEAKVKEIVGAETTSAITAWSGSEAGKKIIGAESSRIAMEALASVGTIPAKPAPAPAAGNETPEQKAAALIAEGKFEEAYKLDEKLRAEFPSAAHFAAYARNSGSVKITANRK